MTPLHPEPGPSSMLSSPSLSRTHVAESHPPLLAPRPKVNTPTDTGQTPTGLPRHTHRHPWTQDRHAPINLLRHMEDTWPHTHTHTRHTQEKPAYTSTTRHSVGEQWAGAVGRWAREMDSFSGHQLSPHTLPSLIIVAHFPLPPARALCFNFAGFLPDNPKPQGDFILAESSSKM